MFIHTRGSATKRLPNLNSKNEILWGKKRKKLLGQPSQTDYNTLNFFRLYIFITLSSSPMLKLIDLEGVIFGYMCSSYPLLFMLFVFLIP